MYDPLINYTPTYFKHLAPRELQILFEEAKRAAFDVNDSKLIRKINKDISSMRLLLTGFDSEYNGKHK